MTYTHRILPLALGLLLASHTHAQSDIVPAKPQSRPIAVIHAADSTSLLSTGALAASTVLRTVFPAAARRQGDEDVARAWRHAGGPC